MAEALGIAASGVGIASLAIQVGDYILKLKRFCDAVKNAPEEIKHLIEEIETLSLVLSESEGIEHPGLYVRPDSKSRCFKFCQKATSILSGVVKDLEADIKNRRRVGSVKAVLKKHTIEKLRERLMAAQSMLMLSSQMYLVELEKRNQQAHHDWATTHQQELQELRVILTQTTETFQTSRSVQEQAVQTSMARAAEKDPLEQRIVVSRNTDGTAAGFQITKPHSNQRMKLKARICTPKWLFRASHGIEIYESWANAGWNFNIQVYNIVPDDAPIFKMARENNTNGIQQLFISGQVSPFCRDENGMTVLDWAACRQTLGLCRFLVHEGADPNISSRSSAIVLAGRNPPMSESDGILDLIRLLAQYSELQDPFDMQEEWNHCSLDGEALALILRESNSTYQERSVEKRVAFALKFCTVWQPAMASVARNVLRGLEFDSTICSLSDQRRETLLHKAATSLGYMASHPSLQQGARFDDLVGIVGDLVKGGSNNHALTNNGRTPMLEVLEGFLYFPYIEADSQHFIGPLTVWLTLMQSCGLDLRDYGRREKAVLQRPDFSSENPEFEVWESRKRGKYGKYKRVRMINFNYGPNPDDWVFWFAPVMEDWFSEFWDMLDHPERAMPGAWEAAWHEDSSDDDSLY